MPSLGHSASLAARPSASGPVAWIRRHPFLSLVLLVYLFEWIVLVPEALAEVGWLPFRIPGILEFIAGWGPGLAAIIVVGAIGGKRAILTLLRRYLIWRIHIGWYLLALFATAAFILGGIGLHVLLGGTAPTLPTASMTPGDIVLTLLVFVVFGLVANMEDVAWRGVALPQLQSTHSALVASLIIGVLEALTHLPYFVSPGDFRRQVGLFWFMAFTIAIVIVNNWMYNNTRGSILIVTLYHASQNAWANLLDTTPSPGPNDIRPFIFAVVLMWVVALGVIILFGPARLSRKPVSELAYVNEGVLP